MKPLPPNKSIVSMLNRSLPPTATTRISKSLNDVNDPNAPILTTTRMVSAMSDTDVKFVDCSSINNRQCNNK